MTRNPSLGETLKRREGEPKEVRAVHKFIRTAWEHALVTKEVKRHRREAILKFHQFFKDRRLDLKHIVGTLVGGSLWGVDTRSDYDFALFFTNWEDRERISNLLINESMGWPGTTCPLHFLLAPVVLGDVLEKGRVSLVPSPFLFTPDEYTVGNIQLARELRLKLLENIHSSGQERKQWKIAQRIFLKNYVGWRDLWYPSEEDPRKRKTRFRGLLEERASDSGSPKRYKKAFLTQLRQIRLPDFETYRKALIELHGALSIH